MRDSNLAKITLVFLALMILSSNIQAVAVTSIDAKLTARSPGTITVLLNGLPKDKSECKVVLQLANQQGKLENTRYTGGADYAPIDYAQCESTVKIPWTPKYEGNFILRAMVTVNGAWATEHIKPIKVQTPIDYTFVIPKEGVVGEPPVLGAALKNYPNDRCKVRFYSKLDWPGMICPVGVTATGVAAITSGKLHSYYYSAIGATRDINVVRAWYYENYYTLEIILNGIEWNELKRLDRNIGKFENLEGAINGYYINKYGGGTGVLIIKHMSEDPTGMAILVRSEPLSLPPYGGPDMMSALVFEKEGFNELRRRVNDAITRRLIDTNLENTENTKLMRSLYSRWRSKLSSLSSTENLVNVATAAATVASCMYEFWKGPDFASKSCNDEELTASWTPDDTGTRALAILVEVDGQPILFSARKVEIKPEWKNVKINEIGFDPESPAVGNDVTITAKLENHPKGKCRVEFKLKDGLLGWRPIGSQDCSDTVKQAWTAPKKPGSYEIKAEVKIGGYSGLAGEGTAKIEVGMSKILSVDVSPSSVYIGEAVSINAELDNLPKDDSNCKVEFHQKKGVIGRWGLIGTVPYCGQVVTQSWKPQDDGVYDIRARVKTRTSGGQWELAADGTKAAALTVKKGKSGDGADSIQQNLNVKITSLLVFPQPNPIAKQTAKFIATIADYPTEASAGCWVYFYTKKLYLGKGVYSQLGKPQPCQSPVTGSGTAGSAGTYNVKVRIITYNKWVAEREESFEVVAAATSSKTS